MSARNSCPAEDESSHRHLQPLWHIIKPFQKYLRFVLMIETYRYRVFLKGTGCLERQFSFVFSLIIADGKEIN
jgi:hypothetical protein